MRTAFRLSKRAARSGGAGSAVDDYIRLRPGRVILLSPPNAARLAPMRFSRHAMMDCLHLMKNAAGLHLYLYPTGQPTAETISQNRATEMLRVLLAEANGQNYMPFSIS